MLLESTIPRSRAVQALFISIICLGFPLRTLDAQPVPEDQMPTVPEIKTGDVAKTFDADGLIQHLQGTFSGITSFAYASQFQTPQDWNYTGLTWREMGPSYYYDMATHGKEPDSIIHRIDAFDGKRTTHLIGDQMSVRDGEGPLSGPQVMPSPLHLYAFLTTDGAFIGMKDLQSNSPLWAKLKSRMAYAGMERFMDHDAMVVRFWGGYNQHFNQTANYDVYFDAQSLTPLGWKAFDTSRRLIEQLEVVDTKTLSDPSTNVSFACPSHNRITEYQWGGTITGPQGVIKYLKSVRDENLSGLRMNDLTADDVTIDPGLAKWIVDANSHTMIPNSP